jgi:hypothetical protein
MIEFFIKHFEAIAGSVLFICFGGYIAWRTWNKQRFITASDKFRSTILTELLGIYPVNGFWKPEVYPQIQKTVPIIKKAALEFRPTIPFYRKRRFDKAVTEYCDQCQNMKWDKAVTDVVFSDEIKTTQKEQFVKCVNHLLSFTA